jgi:hypothetical protein
MKDKVRNPICQLNPFKGQQRQKSHCKHTLHMFQQNLFIQTYVEVFKEHDFSFRYNRMASKRISNILLSSYICFKSSIYVIPIFICLGTIL